MSGNRSKNKGTRIEYLVRDYFRSIGYEADRVPSSGAAQGFPGDIKVTYRGKTSLIEVKARKDAFKSIYSFYHKWKPTSGNLRFNSCGFCITISLNFSGLLDEVDSYYAFMIKDRTIGKIVNLQKVVKECDYLVIKDNNQPLLFLRYIHGDSSNQDSLHRGIA